MASFTLSATNALAYVIANALREISPHLEVDPRLARGTGLDPAERGGEVLIATRQAGV